MGRCSFILCSLKSLRSLGSLQNSISLMGNFITSQKPFLQQSLGRKFSCIKHTATKSSKCIGNLCSCKKTQWGLNYIQKAFKPLSKVKLALEALQICCINFSLKFLWLVVHRVWKMQKGHMRGKYVWIYCWKQYKIIFKKVNTTFRLMCWRKINKISIPDVVFQKVTEMLEVNGQGSPKCL